MATSMINLILIILLFFFTSPTISKNPSLHPKRTPYFSMDPNSHTQGKQYWPWPSPSPTCGGWQAITLCFANRASAQSLSPLLDHAVAKWATASIYSNVIFMLDWTCQTSGIEWEEKETCICEDTDDVQGGVPGTSKSSLRIKDVLASDPDRRNVLSETHATVGYRPHEAFASQLGQRESVNYLDFGALLRGVQKESEEWEFAAFTMVHELGHVLGLEHEHQRPDADQHIIFIYANVNPGLQNKWRATLAGMGDEPELQGVEGSNPRMEVAVKDWDLATKVGNGLNQYAQYTRAQADRIGLVYGSDDHGMAYDFDSIMAYSSWKSAERGEDEEGNLWEEMTFIKKQPFLNSGAFEPIIPGGSEKYLEAAPSWGDVERVARMYPTREGVTRFWVQESQGDGGDDGQKRDEGGKSRRDRAVLTGVNAAKLIYSDWTTTMFGQPATVS